MEPLRIGWDYAGGWSRRERKGGGYVEIQKTFTGREDEWVLEVGDGVVNDTCFGREGRGVHIGGCEIPMVAHRACRVPPMHVA